MLYIPCVGDSILWVPNACALCFLMFYVYAYLFSSRLRRF